MSSVEELEISGIRSFDPSSRESVIFFKPLTVILGNNGAGKTTIIESLLNATAGKFPPGCGTERASFVYDPKVIGDSTVKAQVRLKFTARDGNLCRVIRSYEVSSASRKNDKPKFCSLDTVISQKDEKNGVFAHANFGSTEADFRMRELLGVSSAVLEHVIFCHQEDCNWPLGSASDVKPIFDAIFAATRYVAALENLKENHKRMGKELKEYERTLVELRQHKDQASELRDTIKRREEGVRIIEMRNRGMEPQVQDLRTATAALDSMKSTVDRLTVEAAQVEGRILEKMIQTKRTNPGAPTKQSLPELLEMRQNFHSHMDRLEGEVKKMEATIGVMDGSRRQQEIQEHEWRSKVSELERDARDHRDVCARIREVTSTLTEEFVIGEGQMDEAALARLSALAKENHLASAQALDKEVALNAAKEGALESDISDVLRTLDADSKEREMKEKQVQLLQSRIAEAEEELRARPTSHSSQTEKECAALQSRLEAAISIRQQGTEYALETSLADQLENGNREIANLRVKISERKRLCAQEAKIPFLRERISKQERWTCEQVQLIAPELSKLGRPIENPSASTVCLAVERFRDQKVETQKAMEREVLQLEHEILALSRNERLQQETLAGYYVELQRLKAQFAAVAGADAKLEDYEAELASAEEKHLKCCRHLSSIESMARCYEGFVATAKSEMQCVVCKRGLNDSALSDFIKLNEDRQKTTPEQVERARRDMKAAHDRVQKLKSVSAVAKEVNRIQLAADDETVTLRRTQSDLATKRALLGDATNKRHSVESQVSAAQQLFEVASRVNIATGETARLKDELAAAEQVEKSDESLPLEELEAIYDNLMQAQQIHSNQLQELQRRKTGGGDEYAIQLELTKRRGDLLEMRANEKQNLALRAAISTLLQEVDDHRNRLREISSRKNELQAKVDAARTNLQRQKASWQVTFQELTDARNRFEQQYLELDRLIPVALRFFHKKTGDALGRAKESQKAAELSCNQVAIDIAALRAEISKNQAVLSDQHRQFANLNNHIQFMELQKSLEEDRKLLVTVTDELAKLKQDPLRGLSHLVGQLSGSESMQAIRDTLQEKINELERVRAQSEGNAEAIRAEVAEMQHKLSGERFHTIDDRYSSIFIKLQTLELAIGDIDKYYKALDKAVQSYHQDKILQVNSIISELWRAIYRGSDIDTIELKSEVEGVAATASGTSKRNYNYRVVMKRGNNEIDMRAKCSAGQKVLACVVIRVALSEAFSTDCGVLALDEPTTNLDEDNARSLAEALRDLIAARRNTKGFQLVVITHDEQFVRALGSQSSVERFYFVHKDREGAFSKIEERSFEQLFA